MLVLLQNLQSFRVAMTTYQIVVAKSHVTMVTGHVILMETCFNLTKIFPQIITRALQNYKNKRAVYIIKEQFVDLKSK